MQKARIIVREQIIGIKNDFGLRALNGIYESPFECFKDSTSGYRILSVLVHKYKKTYKHLNYSTIHLDFAN